MLNAMNQHKIKPIIDEVFSIEKSKDAYNYLKEAKHFGKVCIKHDS